MRRGRGIEEMAAGGGILLSSGHKMPIIGLGVWRMEGKSIRDLVLSSIKIGYRHFDCAGPFSTSLTTFTDHRHLGRKITALSPPWRRHVQIFRNLRPTLLLLPRSRVSKCYADPHFYSVEGHSRSAGCMV